VADKQIIKLLEQIRDFQKQAINHQSEMLKQAQSASKRQIPSDLSRVFVADPCCATGFPLSNADLGHSPHPPFPPASNLSW
jgi:hypothetical protein